jgi:bifunctional non-homologous end joining protein LigD
VAELLEGAEPELIVSRMTKTLRAGKVLVDWSQNDEKKTTVNVYSLRARDRPTVSTPVTWDEVAACARAGDPELLVFDADDVLRRVAEQGDLFADALALVQELPRL